MTPALGALAWWFVLRGQLTLDSEEAFTGILFLGGPLLLVMGIHHRLGGYVHARRRQLRLSLPIGARDHFVDALPTTRRGLIYSTAFGLAAIFAAEGSLGGGFWFALSWLWLCIFAWLVEPAVGAAGAYGGRRFSHDHAAAQIQRSLSGGWTSPEAVVHLYGPGLGIVVCTFLAMPGQIVWEYHLNGHVASLPMVIAALLPLLVAIGLRVMASRMYEVGVWEAVPWLEEAIRTLAGPPRPERQPRWIAFFARDPAIQICWLQFSRLTTGTAARLAIVVSFTVYLGFRSEPPTSVSIGIGVGISVFWLLPLRTLRNQERLRSVLCAALPVRSMARSGRTSIVFPYLLLPPIVLASVALVRWTLA